MVSAVMEQATTIFMRLSEYEAQQLTDEINNKADSLRHSLLRFFEGNGWEALGYDSFKAWASVECRVSFQHAYKLMNIARIENDLSVISGADIEVPVNVGSQLAKLPETLRLEAYHVAQTHARTSQRDITEKDAQKAVGIVQKREFVRHSPHQVLVQMVNEDTITVDGGLRIAKLLDQSKPQTIVYVQELMVKGLQNVGVIERVIKRHREFVRTGEVSKNLTEIDNTGRIAGVPLDRATEADWKKMSEQNRLEHIAEETERKRVEEEAAAKARGETYKPVVPKAMNAYTNDPERTLHELKAVLDDETLDGLFQLMAQERGITYER